MAIFEFHIHQVVDVDRLLKEIKLINLKLTNIMGKLDDLKDKLALQDTAIDGLQADLTFIKGKLANATNGLTAAEVDELNTLIDARTAKLQELDAQTDSTEPQA